MPLINIQYDSIMREYARRQARSRHELEERLARIHRELPALSSLEDEITACQAGKVRAAVSQDRKQAETLDAALQELVRKREALLAAHGLKPSDLEPVYACPDCQDTGYIGEQKCHCFLQAEIDLLYHQSHLREVLERENFRTFSYEWYEGEDREIMRRNVMEARLFIEHFDDSFQNLLLLGAVGTGKTFLSNCIAKELMDRYCSVIYLSAPDLFEVFSKVQFHDQEEDLRDMYRYILDCDLLIIDDLGTELNNSFTSSRLFYCINERMNLKRSTIISTNLSVAALRDHYTDRVTSRIMSGYTVIPLYGGDIRLLKRKREREA